MNNQLSHYISIEPDFFQELEGEFGVKITGKLANFLRTVEIVCPNRFMTSEMKWCGVGRKKLDREKFFRAFLLKAEFRLPTTKVLIERQKRIRVGDCCAAGNIRRGFRRKRLFPVFLPNLRKLNCPARFMRKSWWKTVMMN